MSTLSDDELKRLTKQLVDETFPERPSDEEAHAVAQWAEGVRVGQIMLAMVLDGEATVRVTDGEPSFKLTERGMASAESLLASSPAARAMHDELVADFLKRPLAKGPDETQ